MHISMKSMLLICCLLGAAGAAPTALASIDQTVRDRLAAHPAQTAEQEEALCAALLDLGPDAVKSLCRLLAADGDDTRPRTVLQSLAVMTGKEGRHTQRLLFVQAVSESFAMTSKKEIQAFLIELLQWAGGDESVDVLSGFVTDDRLCDPAVRALTTIGTPKAKEALVAALAKDTVADRPGVVVALGTLRVKQAAVQIARYAESSEPGMELAAHWALANIGYEPAEKSIAAALTSATQHSRAAAGAHYLLLARRLAENGRPEQTAAMCRRLLSEGTLPTHLRSGALETLVSAASQGAMNDLLAAASGNDDSLQAAAVALADRIEGTQATKQWIGLLENADARLTERLAIMLGRRGDNAALPAVIGLLMHNDDSVAVAAMTAAIRLDQEKAIGAILEMLRQTDRQNRRTAGVDVLMRLPGEKALQAAAQSLPAMPAETRIKLMEGLAGRRAAAYSRQIMAYAADPDPAVRRAAIRALAFCAAERDLSDVLTLMLNSEDQAERSGLQRAVVAAAMQHPDSETRAAPVLARLPEADTADKAILLRTAGLLGGADALKTVLGLVKSPDPVLKDAAIRALADWPDAAAAAGLMEVVRTEELSYQVIALRSALRVLQDSELPDVQKVLQAKQALSVVTRNEEKQLILSFLSRIKTLQSLMLAADYLDDETLRTAAAVAVAGIALPGADGQPGLDGAYTANVLTRAMDHFPEEAVRQRVRAYLATLPPPANAQTKTPPEGFTALFNGKDLTGWRGVLLPPHDNPLRRAELNAEDRAALQAKADEHMRAHWSVQDGVLLFDGKGFSLSTMDDYEDFELVVDWKIDPLGDSGIYLRGSPQVQIWDPARWPVGSGGLYNNKNNPSEPRVCADKPIGQWNTFYIRMIDQRVTVKLNDTLIVDNVILENYWDRSQPIFPTGPIELQCHGDPVWFSNIFVRRIPTEERRWSSLFNGKDWSGWTGDTAGYAIEDGVILWRGGGNLYTEKQYGDFHFTCEFRVAADGNSGIGIRTPRDSQASYQGMEIQILDDSAAMYANLKPYQYCGSIYGVVPAKRGHLKPVGQWNTADIIAKGRQITVVLNGETIVDADLTDAIENGTMDGRDHPGLRNTSGHIALLGHGPTEVAFRNIKIKELPPDSDSEKP